MEKKGGDKRKGRRTRKTSVVSAFCPLTLPAWLQGRGLCFYTCSTKTSRGLPPSVPHRPRPQTHKHSHQMMGGQIINHLRPLMPRFWSISFTLVSGGAAGSRVPSTFVCFGRAVSRLRLLGVPHTPHLTEQMRDRRADRYTDGLRQTVR